MFFFCCEGNALEFSGSVCEVQLRVFQLVSGLPQEVVHSLPLSGSISLCIIARRLVRAHQFSAAFCILFAVSLPRCPLPSEESFEGYFEALSLMPPVKSLHFPVHFECKPPLQVEKSKSEDCRVIMPYLFGQDVSKQNEKSTCIAHRVSTCRRSVSAVGIFSATLCSHGLYRLERWILASWSGIREARNERL